MKMRPLFSFVAISFVALTLATPSSAQSLVTVDLVTVGDAGNAADTTGYGAVAYEYAIGKYEVSLLQYTAFLNAVAATDAYNLYNASMATSLNTAGISQSGSSGSYGYSLIGGGNRPVTHVSWFDAARFANWMHNGATSGASTETGAYTLNGAESGIFLKNPGATWWIPTENEWYKAAYYKGGGTNAGYWLYPTQSDSAPGNAIGAGANQANYFTGVFSVTQSDAFSGDQNYLTDGGAFSGSGSYYGTYDQGGNVWEWNDAVLDDDFMGPASARGRRGGDWIGAQDGLLSSSGGGVPPWSDSFLGGFRLASATGGPGPTPVPEPGTWAAAVLLAGAAGYVRWRRRRTA
jgi:formylglycine-generating enzyme